MRAHNRRAAVLGPCSVRFAAQRCVPRRTLSHTNRHDELIRDQFTKQAEQFSKASPLNDQLTLDRIISFAGARPTDEMLDVACGPGIIACAFAPHVKRVSGLDMTHEMLVKARALKTQRNLTNVEFLEGSALELPFPIGSFSLVTTRFSFHHFLDPLLVLKEMKRVCTKGGRVLVIDLIPEKLHAVAFNRLELLRDPSHVRALPREEIAELFKESGLSRPRVMTYRMHSDVDNLLARSYPATKEDEKKARQIFTDALTNDAIGVQPKRAEDGRILYSYPVGVFVADV